MRAVERCDIEGVKDGYSRSVVEFPCGVDDAVNEEEEEEAAKIADNVCGSGRVRVDIRTGSDLV